MTDTQSYLPALTADFQDSPLSSQDLIAAERILWQLLAHRTECYTAGNSTSVPVELAQDLLQSICLILEIDPENWNLHPQSVRALLQKSSEELWQEGVHKVEQKVEYGKKLWHAACLTAVKIPNLSYCDTLKSIGFFWKKYHYLFFAHQIPCDIDYQLCLPVNETLRGIDYVNEYLHHILLENELINQFLVPDVIDLLGHFCQDYRGLLINLYEPVATNAIGLTLVRENPMQLNISEHERQQIAQLLSNLCPSEQEKALCGAADTLSASLGLKISNAPQYLRQTAVNLLPRIRVALLHHSLDGIFLGAE